MLNNFMSLLENVNFYSFFGRNSPFIPLFPLNSLLDANNLISHDCTPDSIRFAMGMSLSSILFQKLKKLISDLTDL